MSKWFICSFEKSIGTFRLAILREVGGLLQWLVMSVHTTYLHRLISTWDSVIYTAVFPIYFSKTLTHIPKPDQRFSYSVGKHFYIMYGSLKKMQ